MVEEKRDDQHEADRSCHPEVRTPHGMVEVAPGLYATRRSTSVFIDDNDEDDQADPDVQKAAK
jgi:hypothetical protein